MAGARLYIEYNATDGDLGVHGAIDDVGWSVLCMLDPSGRRVLLVNPQSQTKDLGLGSFSFESREPPLAELSLQDLAAAFPEGVYTAQALGLDGRLLRGEATFSHAIPMAPTITAPSVAVDEETAVEALVPLEDLVVSWGPVASTLSGDPVVVTAYEVIVTEVDHDDPNGFSQPLLDVHMPPSAASFPVPAAFLEPDTVYELEVLVLEESGNQTISVGFFATPPTGLAG